MEKMQESELAAMKWFDMEEVEGMPIFSQGVFRSVIQCCKAHLEGRSSGFKGLVCPNTFTKRSELILCGGDVRMT